MKKWQRVIYAHKMNPGATDKEIAEQCGCSAQLAYKVRRNTFGTVEPETQEMRQRRFQNLIASARLLLIQASKMCSPEVQKRALEKLNGCQQEIAEVVE